MPTVPYSPVPTEAPSGQGAPSLNINTPSDAFGVNIGQALEGLGKTTEGAGNEIFGRAMAIQQLNNETEAKQADADYMIKAGELHAQYSSLEGQAAVQAYPDYAKNLEKLRTDIRGTMSNDMARKMYDGSSLSTMGRSIFNGAGHAATQNKQWAIGTAKAQIDLDAKTVEDNPKDDGLFQQKLNRVQGSVNDLVALQGLGDDSPQAKDLGLKATSKLWSQRIVGLSRAEPFAAAKMLDEHSTDMTEDDRLKVDNTVRAQGRAVGSVNIANEVYSAHRSPDGTLDVSPQALDQEVRDKAKALNPDDPLLAQHAVTALHGQMNQDKYSTKQFQYDNTQTIDGAIQQGVSNIQELRADPKVAAAIDALPKDKQLAIPGAINRYNASRDQKTKEDAAISLRGLSNNDVEAFLNTDITKQPLAKGDMDKFMQLQQRLKQNQNGDPRVLRAVGQIRGSMGAQLEALGIYSRTQANKEDYDHFTGAISTALDVWTETHGKPATSKDITDTIAPQILQQQTQKGYLWDSKTPFYNVPPPSDFKEKLVTDIKSRGGLEPTDEQVQRAYTRMQYIKLYGGKKADE